MWYYGCRFSGGKEEDAEEHLKVQGMHVLLLPISM
jgi:hypothetical protein